MTGIIWKLDENGVRRPYLRDDNKDWPLERITKPLMDYSKHEKDREEARLRREGLAKHAEAQAKLAAKEAA